MQTVHTGSFKNLIMLLKNIIKTTKGNIVITECLQISNVPCDAFFPLAVFQYLALILQRVNLFGLL